MAKHRQIPQHSLHARTVMGGVLASGALLVGAPAGMALAHHGTEGTDPPKPAISTSSPNLAKPSAQQPVPISEENRDLTNLVIALGTKAATDPGLAKLLGKLAPFTPACLGTIPTTCM
jgi:hypothetical protein